MRHQELRDRIEEYENRIEKAETLDLDYYETKALEMIKRHYALLLDVENLFEKEVVKRSIVVKEFAEIYKQAEEEGFDISMKTIVRMQKLNKVVNT